MSQDNSDIDFILLDEIDRLLAKHHWISTYEMFYQIIGRLNSYLVADQSQKPTFTIEKKQNSGVALRALSKANRLFEISLGISSLHKLADISEPRSTVRENHTLKFPELKQPRISSVPGDSVKSVDFNETTAMEKLNLLNFDFHNQKIISTQSHMMLEKETRLIKNQISDGIESSSLKVEAGSTVKFHGAGFENTISRQYFRRNFDYNYDDINSELFLLIRKRSSKPVAADISNISVIFHPEIIGKILAYQSNALISTSSYRASQIWKDNIFLYDDPLRDGGYGSILFDDEGTLTKAKILIENGSYKDAFENLSTGQMGVGGNAYRTEWFQPLPRSYEYSISNSISNLVMDGGVGKGENLIERTGYSLVVIRGHGYIGGMANNPKFVVHASETELWKNGNFLGQSYNYTFSGSLNEIMNLGDLTSDQIPVVDKAIPGAIYTGWLRCPNGTVNIG